MAKRDKTNKANRTTSKSAHRAGITPHHEKKPGQPIAWMGLLIGVLAMLLYVNTLGHQFCLDDYSAIKDNWVVKGGIKNIQLIFSKEYRYGVWNSPGSLYRPIPLAMFAAEWQLSPDNPFLHHFINVLLYGLTGWLLWYTWRDILSDRHPLLPAFTTLLFIAHPVHTEVVANIKSRDEILAMLFGMLALRSLWVGRNIHGNRHLFVAAFWYTLAMFSKESAVTLLAIYPLTLWCFGGAQPSKLIRTTIVMALPVALFLLARQSVLAAQTGKEAFSILDNFIVGASSGADKLASAFMMCMRYLQVLIWPNPLISDLGYRQMEPVGFTDLRALGGMLSFGAAGIWALYKLPQKHTGAFAILFFLIAFSLFSNIIITIGTSYGERLLFLPSWGFALLLAWVLTQLPGLNNNPKASWGVLFAILSVYSYLTIRRNPAWFDSGTLYRADIGNSPNCAKLNYHLGLELVKEGLDETTGKVTDSISVANGIQQYSRALELYPGYHDAYGSRGLAYFRLQQYDEAKRDYDKALLNRPNDAKVLSNMGFIYFLRNQLDSAELVYRRSIKNDPRFLDARRNLGAVLAMQKRFPEAIAEWEEGLKFEPNNATLLKYIGSAYNDMGQPEKGKPYLERSGQ